MILTVESTLLLVQFYGGRICVPLKDINLWRRHTTCKYCNFLNISLTITRL